MATAAKDLPANCSQNRSQNTTYRKTAYAAEALSLERKLCESRWALTAMGELIGRAERMPLPTMPSASPAWEKETGCPCISVGLSERSKTLTFHCWF